MQRKAIGDLSGCWSIASRIKSPSTSRLRLAAHALPARDRFHPLDDCQVLLHCVGSEVPMARCRRVGRVEIGRALMLPVSKPSPGALYGTRPMPPIPYASAVSGK